MRASSMKRIIHPETGVARNQSGWAAALDVSRQAMAKRLALVEAGKLTLAQALSRAKTPGRRTLARPGERHGDLFVVADGGMSNAQHFVWCIDVMALSAKVTLTRSRRTLVAAPSYLARFGRPRTLDDLAQHKAIHYMERNPDDWSFVRTHV